MTVFSDLSIGRDTDHQHILQGSRAKRKNLESQPKTLADSSTKPSWKPVSVFFCCIYCTDTMVISDSDILLIKFRKDGILHNNDKQMDRMI